MTIIALIGRLAWLCFIVWGAWRLGIAVLGMPWRFRRHREGFGGYVRDSFVANLPFIMAFVVIWASVPLTDTLGGVQVIAGIGIVLGLAIVLIGRLLPGPRHAEVRLKFEAAR